MMKAKIHTELACGTCGARMQYHKESTVVRCPALKCPDRNKEFEVPTIELKPVGQAEVKKRGRKAKPESAAA